MHALRGTVIVFAVFIGLGSGAEPTFNCPVPVSPANGQVDLLTDGSMVQFACDPGFEITGAKYKRCFGDKWTPEVETACLPVNEVIIQEKCSEEEMELCDQECYRTGGIYQCSCGHGYTLIDKHTCGDINECESDNYGCSDQCLNTPGSAFCICPKGYATLEDSKTCADIDECATKNGGCEGLCENFDGEFRCGCTAGYLKTDVYVCTDIDECMQNNGECDQECVNFDGGHYCSCYPGYKLEADQKSCRQLTCSRLQRPLHGSIQCRDNRETDYENAYVRKKLHYPASTQCNYMCRRGYRLSDEGSITCLMNETWSRPPPHCISIKCPPLKAPPRGFVAPNTCKEITNFQHICYFKCSAGYRLTSKHKIYRCSSNGEWKPRKIPKCTPIIVKDFTLTCQEDISVTLPIGFGSIHFNIMPLIMNADVSYLKWDPNLPETNGTMEFKVGITAVLFNITKNKIIDTCATIVEVIDTEPPSVMYCPESFQVQANSTEGAVVAWKEPHFEDNVEIVQVHQNLKSDSFYTPGNHTVIYRVRDEAKNTAVCNFTVEVIAPECGYPVGPKNGDANCNDWAFGRICEPVCNTGYVLYPPEPSIFSCNETGLWNPGNLIQDCKSFLRTRESTCIEGFELLHQDYEAAICVRCSGEFEWSRKTQKCTRRNNTYFAVT